MPPVLHLTNWASRSQHGPGRRLCAMDAPRRWEHGDGRCPWAAPRHLDFGRWRTGRLSLDGYRECCDRWFARSLEAGQMTPGLMHAYTRDLYQAYRYFVVSDGDTLLCACPRPDSPKRRHPCHLEWLAHFLVRAGWGVVLYGVRL